MSMNIVLEAVMNVLSVKSGTNYIMTKKFPCYQTPTAITYKIIESSDKYKEYCNWILSSPDKYSMEPIYYLDYNENDSPEETERKYLLDIDRVLVDDTISNLIIGYTDSRLEHIKKLDNWIKDCVNEGYDELEWSLI